MTPKTLEEQAREEAAKRFDNYKFRRSDFTEGYLAAAEPREREIEALRAKVSELEGRVPRWCGDEEHSRLLTLAWTCAPDAIWHRPPGAIEAEWHFLMVPPIPLPGDAG